MRLLPVRPRTTRHREATGERARRRVGGEVWALTAARLVLVALVVAGPLLAGFALVTARAHGSGSPRSAGTIAVPAGVEALAGRFVAAYLAGDSTAFVRDDHHVPDTTAPSSTTTPLLVLPAGARPDRSGWRVTVAVQSTDLTADGFWSVGVTASAGGWQVAGWPARVRDPARASVVALTGLNTPRADDRLLAAAEPWLRAYLTGGDVSRWTSPQWTSAGSLPGHPFDSVTVVGYRVSGPADRPLITVEVSATATSTTSTTISTISTAASMTTASSMPLSSVAAPGTSLVPLVRTMTYQLILAARDGRWEVAALFPVVSSGSSSR